MRGLTIVVAIVAALYSGYWFIGSTRIERAAGDALAQMQQNGWGVSYDNLQTKGFPSRFDTTIEALDLRAPSGDFGWQVPFVQVFALSYQPQRAIAAIADQQQLRWGGQTIDLATNGLRASGGVEAGLDLAFDDLTVEVGAATAVSSFGWAAAIDRGLVALRARVPQPQTYDVYFDADALSVTNAPPITRLVFDSTVVLDRTLDRHLLGDISPAIREITLRQLAVNWPRVALTGSGTLQVDNNGVPSGDIMMQTGDWRALVPVLVEGGWITPRLQFTLLAILENLAAGDSQLRLPLRFADGAMALGPIPLGPAPRLR